MNYHHLNRSIIDDKIVEGYPLLSLFFIKKVTTILKKEHVNVLGNIADYNM